MALKPKISQFLPRVKPRVGDFLAFLLRFGKKSFGEIKDLWKKPDRRGLNGEKPFQ